MTRHLSDQDNQIRGKLGTELNFWRQVFSRDLNKMPDKMEVEVSTNLKTSKDEAMEVDLPQKEKAPAKESSGASSSSVKHSKGFELPW